MLNLELLAYNFHESLNLKPLFLDCARQITRSKGERRDDWRRRISRVAKEITAKAKGEKREFKPRKGFRRKDDD